MDKVYNIFLDDRLIGTTMFEKADTRMGVVFGQIRFIDISKPYDFFKYYCQENKVDFEDYSEDKVISTRTISTLKVTNDKGKEIKGLGNQISGIETGTFELTLEGVPYPFYGEEFPHHVSDND